MDWPHSILELNCRKTAIIYLFWFLQNIAVCWCRISVYFWHGKQMLCVAGVSLKLWFSLSFWNRCRLNVRGFFERITPYTSRFHPFCWQVVIFSAVSPTAISCELYNSDIAVPAKLYTPNKIQANAVITRYNIHVSWYYIYHYRNRGWIWMRDWIHKWHPIPHSKERAMGCLTWGVWIKWTAL